VCMFDKRDGELNQLGDILCGLYSLSGVDIV
jgi:hypothetical protein